MSQPLSILYCFARFDPGEGWGRRAMRVIEALGDRARHTIAADAYDAPLPPGATATLAQAPPPLAGGVSVARFEAIARAMRGYDVVLSHGAGAIDAAMARRAFPRGAPPVIHHENPDGTTIGGGARLYRRIALGAAAALVVETPEAASVAATRWKVPAERLHTVPDGVDLSAFARGADARIVAAFRRKPADVAIGVLADRADPDETALLVRAVAGLTARFRLVVVGGEGAARAAAERGALAMGIDDRLVLPGALAPPSAWLGGLDVLLLPLRAGPVPGGVVEAMAAGVPVMGLRGDALSAQLSAENAALLAPHVAEVALRDALQPLASDAALRAAVGAANRARAVRDHDAAATVARAIALYGSVAGRPGWPG